MTNKSDLVTQDQVSVPAVDRRYIGLIEAAIEKGVDIAHLERLMDLQERHEANQAKKYFDAAMAEFQSALPVIGKLGLVDYTTNKGRTFYNYAKLEDIAVAIRPALKRAGLSYRFNQSQNQGWITVTCIVTHSGGHSESSELTSQPDVSGGKDPLKAIASAISYLRRYTLTGVLGVVVGGEDDDAGADAGNHDQACADTYPDDQFSANLEKWKNLIISGNKTPERLIEFISSKGVVLSDDQISKIKKLGE